MPGILIGYAVDVKEDEQRLMKDGYLIPAADFDDLSEVLVIKEIKSDSFKDENSGDGTLEGMETTGGNEVPAGVAEGNANITSTWSGMEGLTPLSEVVNGQESEVVENFPISASDIAEGEAVEVTGSSKEDTEETTRESSRNSSSENEERDTEETTSETSNEETERETERETESVQEETDDSSNRNNREVQDDSETEDTEELIEENPN